MPKQMGAETYVSYVMPMDNFRTCVNSPSNPHTVIAILEHCALCILCLATRLGAESNTMANTTGGCEPGVGYFGSPPLRRG